MLDRLPNEIIYLILSHLTPSPPSYTTGLQAPPTPDIVRAAVRPLKELAQTSSHLAELVRPLLFSSCWCDIDLLDDFLAFAAQSALRRYITSVVVIAHPSDSDSVGVPEVPIDDDENENASDYVPDKSQWWYRLLQELNPLRLTFVAPPIVIGKAMATPVVDKHDWVSFQAVRLEQDSQGKEQQQQINPKHWRNLVTARRWKSVSFNESSWLKAYNHHEYLSCLPSILGVWGGVSMYKWLRPFSLKVTHFRYTAVFPFKAHVRTMMQVVIWQMRELTSLSVQLAPDPSDYAVQIEYPVKVQHRGPIDRNNPWMQLVLGYTVITNMISYWVQHDIWHLSQNVIERFEACDYEIEELREDLFAVIDKGLNLRSRWEHDGHGVWIRKTHPAARLINS